MTKQPTRTYAALHFDDLDPHRFEDLVRQLIHDYRNWIALEALGRSGSEGGFDVRGTEQDEPTISSSDEDTGDDQPTEPTEERIWLIQCKREKTLPPSKAKKYAEEIAAHEDLYGVLFVASCNISLATREAIIKVLRVAGVQHIEIWGAGELEDRLYLEENDRLLYAYFGISLIARKRGASSKVRQILAAKRKAIRVFGEGPDYMHKEVIIRLVSDKSYPYSAKASGQPKGWRCIVLKERYHDGLVFCKEWYLAYVDPENRTFDVETRLPTREGYTRLAYEPEPDDKLPRRDVFHFMDQVPEKNQYIFKQYGLIPFDRIVDIDQHGDQQYGEHYMTESMPVIYVLPFKDEEEGPILQGAHEKLTPRGEHRWGAKSYSAHRLKRIKYFPDEYPPAPELEPIKPMPLINQSPAPEEKPFPTLNQGDNDKAE